MKKITLGLSLAALAIAGTTAGAAYAQNAMRGDADGNGVVTRAEAQTRANERFARMDANSDGKIDQADREARMGRMFDRMDADSNGQVSRGEFMTAHQTMHAGRARSALMSSAFDERMDADKNGQVSRAEFTTAHQSMHAGRGATGMRGNRGSHEGHRGGHGGGHGMMKSMAGMADADKNGAISQAEFTAAAMQRFDRVDTNKDGQIAASERQAARAQMRAEMQKSRAERKPAE